jgi:hypothetical protein
MRKRFTRKDAWVAVGVFALFAAALLIGGLFGLARF